MHRKHHRYSDTPLDVHSPRHRGFWFSHVFWITATDHVVTDMRSIKDHARYPELSDDDLAEYDYTRISGGQRQLALIARALAQETPILVKPWSGALATEGRARRPPNASPLS